MIEVKLIVSVFAIVGFFSIILPRLNMSSISYLDTIIMAIVGCFLLAWVYFELGSKDGD